MKQDFVTALVRAHYDRDDASFRRLALQAAAQIKNEAAREALLKQTQRLTELPKEASGLVTVAPSADLADLILPIETINLLAEIGREVRHGDALALRGLQPRSRLLFTGPPGNGKTSCAGALAASLGRTAYVVQLSAVVESYMGATAQKLTKLFGLLRAGHCVVLDELDSIGVARGGGGKEDNERAHTVNVLLTELDACGTGLLIATTNRPDILDPALLRRFDEVVDFPAPTTVQLRTLRDRLHAKFGLQGSTVVVDDHPSFDALTKAVRRDARRAALAELEATGGR